MRPGRVRATLGLTNGAGSDRGGRARYVTADKRVEFAPGRTTATFAVAVLVDSLTEGPETFMVTASEARNVTLVDPGGVVTILPPTG